MMVDWVFVFWWFGGVVIGFFMGVIWRDLKYKALFSGEKN